MIIRDTNGNIYRVDKIALKKDFHDRLQPDLTFRLVDAHTGALTDLSLEVFFEGSEEHVLTFTGAVTTAYLSGLSPEKLQSVLSTERKGVI